MPQRSHEVLSRLHDAADQVAPVVLAGDRRLEVLPALGHLLPDGLQRGTTVGVRGPGAMSLGLAVAAGPVGVGSWLAAVGCEELSLVGAEQAGVELQRVVLVDQPPLSAWGTVVAALLDAFDVVLVSGPYEAPARDVRRLLSRTRERGSIIIDVGGVWPEAHDTLLETTRQMWSGLGDGHGVLSARRVVVEVSGRRGVRPREVPLWLPGVNTAPAAAEQEGTYAGSDIEELLMEGSGERFRAVG